MGKRGRAVGQPVRAVTCNCPTGWPKGLTAFQANVILHNTFAVQMASHKAQAVRPVSL